MDHQAATSTTLKTPEAIEVRTERITELGTHDLTDALEHGKLVYFPTAPLAPPRPEDVAFLRDEIPLHITSKNLSFYPHADRITGLGGSHEVRDRATRILRDYHERVEAFLKRVIPSFAVGWRSGTSSLRAFQEKDRSISVRSRSDKIHLDAGAYGVTRGDLILRFLTNLDDQERVWRVKGTVADLVEKYGEAAGLQHQGLLRENLPERLYSRLVHGLSAVVPMAQSLDRSAYDTAMRRMHNYMKESDEFQHDPEGACDIRFAPGSCWVVFADMVGHACAWGRFCLIDTFIVPQANFRDRRYTPYEVLRRYERSEPCVI